MSEPQSELAEAIATVTSDPKNQALWEQIEDLAGQLDDPESAADAYRTCLQQDLKEHDAVALGKRAVHFHREWFGDDPAGLSALLTRVLQLDAKSEWAFQELTAALTMAEQWDEAIKLYQDVIAGTTNKVRLVTLLNEAYQVAKDLANRPDEAIDFLKAKIDIEPSAKELAALEKLMERRGRWNDLVELWRDAMPTQGDEERWETLSKIASTYLEKLSNGQEALTCLREIFAENQRLESALQLLETLAVSESIDAALRESVLATVREVFEATERPGDIVRVLGEALPLSSDAQRKGLHAELGERLAALEEHAAALDHYAALLILEPSSVATQRALRREAQLIDRLDRYATALAAAADCASDPTRRVALLTEAAVALLELPDSEEAAIDLLSAAIATEGIRPTDILHVGKRLNLLLDRAGRQSDRLRVLEQLADAESVESSRRGLIGDVAELAEQLGETDRALSAWRRRIQADPGDLRALDRLLELLESEKRWPELIESLTTRRQQSIPTNQKRSDLIRIAHVYEHELEQSERALESWLEVREEFGEDPETVASLSRLMTTLEKWADLAALLEGSNAQQIAYLADQFANLGNAYRQSLGDDRKAIECYRRALTVDVGHEGARQGLTDLLDEPEVRNEVAEALVHSMRSSGNLLGLLDIVEARIAGTDDVRKHSEIYREAADIAESEADDPAKVLGFCTRLFPLTPRDRVLEDRMVRLAGVCEDWQSTLDAWSKAQEAISDDSFALAAMCWREAVVRETQLGDLEGAAKCVQQVLSVQPDNYEAASAAVRMAAAVTDVSSVADAATVLLNFAAATQTIPQELLEAVEHIAENAESPEQSYATLCSSMDEHLRASKLTPVLQAALHLKIAGWQRDKAKNEAAALQSLLRSVERDQSQITAYKQLAALQSTSRDAALYGTLRRLSEIDRDDLAHFHEAALIAVETLDSSAQEQSLSALQGRAIGAWRGSAPAQSATPPEEIVAWTIEKLVALHVEEGEAQRALDVLLDASRLPFEEQVCLNMRKRAAAIATDVLQDPSSAMDMLRAVLAQAPSDSEALDALGTIYQEQGRLPEMLGLKQRGLEREQDSERAIAMRLEIAAIIDTIDAQGGRMALLCENLSQVPGHDDSIAALTTLLRGMGKYSKLCELLAEQAQALERAPNIQRAAVLWNQVAYIAETELEDIEQALEAYRRVANLAPNLEALDSLARLYISRSQSSAAVPWLEQALDLASDDNKAALVKRLAQAHLAANHTDDAIACLQAATANSESALLELRTMLAELHREAEHWQELADTLSASLPHIEGDEAIAAAAREAGDIYHEKLLAPAQAVPALRRALRIVPEDRGLRLMMARSLRCSGDIGAARELLETLITEFGRRRSKERAAIHAELAQIAQAEDNLDNAMEELELASKMDSSNAHILRALADLAREQGDFDRAERSLRALLMTVRRDPPGEDESAVGVSEVLYELLHIATARGGGEPLEELQESVIEASASSDAEVRRLRRTLLKHGQYELLAKVLRGRISLSDSPVSKTQLLGFLADLLEGELKDSKGALEIRLQGLTLLPQDTELHNKARALASATKQLPTYLACLEELIAQQRRAEDAGLTSALLMRAGEVAEQDLEDLNAARQHYAAAEECGDAPAGALFALARVCAAQGDTEEQTRALDALTSLAMAGGPVAAQADALYRLAELQVVQPDLVERGIELLAKALEVEPRYRQAALTLKVAADTSNDAAYVMVQYETAARQSGDKAILLDFLERQANGEQAPLSLIREAVVLAKDLEEGGRSAVLLERAVSVARSSDEGLASALWAAQDLARHYGKTAKLSVAKDLLFDLATLASEDDIMELGLELVCHSQESGSCELSAEILEFLRARDPQARAVWEPLLTLYQENNNGERIAALVDETLPGLVNPGERTQLRLHKAQYLVDSNLDEEAIEVLRDTCLDDPDSVAAAGLLESVLRKEGNEEALGDFLRQRFHDAKERGNPDTIADVAVRLAALLDQSEGDSMEVYQQALKVAPESAALLRGILERLDEDSDYREQANLSERLLRVEAPERAAEVALSLVELREVLDDDEGVQRALELGHQACPEHLELRGLLETLYREGEKWEPLAKMKISQAEAEEETSAQVSLLRAAGALYRDSLSDLHTCATILGRALILDSGNIELVCDLANVMSESGRLQDALDTVTEGLEHVQEEAALPLLLARADLYFAIEKHGEAIADLETALEFDTEQVEPKLVALLEKSRLAASESGDKESERSTTMRLIALFEGQQDELAARAMLFTWIERDHEDIDALQKLRDMDQVVERWDGVIMACKHLVALETGDAQAASALLLADASDQVEGEENGGREGLERAHQDQPENVEIRDRMRALYEGISAHRELATLLLVDAGYCENEEKRYEIYQSAASIFINDLDDADAAIVPAQKAKDLRPDDHATIALLADVLISSGQLDEAVTMLEPAIASHKRRSPELAALQYRMAKVGAARSEQQEQLGWLKKAFDVDRKNGLIASELAHLATELGDYDLALKPLRAITLMDDPEPVSRVMALLWEAKIEHSRGNRAKAELWAKKALREDPAYSEAKEFLLEIAE